MEEKYAVLVSYLLWKRFHVSFLPDVSQVDVIKVFNLTAIYLNDLHDMNNINFRQVVDKLFPTQLEFIIPYSSDT